MQMSQNALQTEQVIDASTTVPVTTVNVIHSTQNTESNKKRPQSNIMNKLKFKHT